MSLWGRDDVRTHRTSGVVWAHDTYRPGKWHLIVGEREREKGPVGAYERRTACGRRLPDSYGYGDEPGYHRWRGRGLPPSGPGRTEGVCRRCAAKSGIA